MLYCHPRSSTASVRAARYREVGSFATNPVMISTRCDAPLPVVGLSLEGGERRNQEVRMTSTTIVGTLVEARDTFIVLDAPNAHIILPPSLSVKNFVIGERLKVGVTRRSDRWMAERIERSPV